jgi:hypothetical protein
MKQRFDDSDTDPTPAHGMRFEFILASVLLAVGLFGMPALIYGVGIAVLGPYGESAGLAKFYSDFFADMAEPSARTWALALGPLTLVTLLRAVFAGTQAPPPPAQRRPSGRPPAESPRPRTGRRVEPRVGGD